jgi:hypothetical protein
MKISVTEIATISHSSVPKILPARRSAPGRRSIFFGFCRPNCSLFNAYNIKTLDYGLIRAIGQAGIMIFADSTIKTDPMQYSRPKLRNKLNPPAANPNSGRQTKKKRGFYGFFRKIAEYTRYGKKMPGIYLPFRSLYCIVVCSC